MSNEFLNEIQFNKKVQLKRPKKQKKKGYKRVPQKIMRLAFFLVTLYVLFLGGRYFLEGFVAFCRGTEHKPWSEVVKDYKEFQEE